MNKHASRQHRLNAIRKEKNHDEDRLIHGGLADYLVHIVSENAKVACEQTQTPFTTFTLNLPEQIRLYLASNSIPVDTKIRVTKVFRHIQGVIQEKGIFLSDDEFNKDEITLECLKSE